MILLAALLCNYGRGFCLIDVGTEGYCEESAKYIFGEALENSTANEILCALRRAQCSLTRNQILAVFHRHKSGTEIDKALHVLLTNNLAHPVPSVGSGRGRPPELWAATP
jgi:hypothetical protein